GCARLSVESEQLGDPAQLRPNDGLPADHTDHGAVLVRRKLVAPLLCRAGRVLADPAKRDLVSIQEPAKVGAAGIPAVSVHDRSWRRGIGGDALQTADPLPGQLT